MESTVAQKLEALTKLQSIDSELDEIIKVRGALPEEVMDLEDEVAGYETRVGNHNSAIEELELSITNNKTAIKDSEKLIQKYEEQQMNVRNNREYDAITKEVELQQLEIQILEKRIKEAYAKIESRNEEILETKNALVERQKDLDNKRGELDNITAESEEEEKKLLKGREKAAAAIEERLLISYNKIRKNVKNGLAVVPVKRDACGGCFNVVPPQKQAEIRERKKLIVCEHCGRVLADVEDVEVEEKKPTRTRRTAKK
ncbi:C4-type zinc ribbon domain-containing protein [Reichenbachiella agarivorans]|uniref:C4-type zinc ribbon domain-containing protein n=1 Tax=Reichenbachiella agarivorans TaxID=2979464 RepID=A0ABY6CPL2_9BACT|nr:C4-type zinc ribbon domain-containing protein [Reichenbachiella agarivorans]UXP32447.1 C4-type zinc ribbon domain-containing protein [Reichenbachiella agarivorans]